MKLIWKRFEFPPAVREYYEELLKKDEKAGVGLINIRIQGKNSLNNDEINKLKKILIAEEQKYNKKQYKIPKEITYPTIIEFNKIRIINEELSIFLDFLVQNDTAFKYKLKYANILFKKLLDFINSTNPDKTIFIESDRERHVNLVKEYFLNGINLREY